MQKKKTSIVVIVIALIVATVSLFLAAAGFAGYSMYSRYERKVLITDAEIEADQATGAFATPMWNFDEQQISEIAKSFMQHKDVFSIVITSADSFQNSFSISRNERWEPVISNTILPEPGLLNQTRELSYSNKHIGNVQVSFTPRFLTAYLHKIRVLLVVIIFGIALLLTIGLYTLLWLIVLKPIKQLEHYVLKVSQGGFDNSNLLEHSFKGELNTLRTSISEMVGLLMSRNAELRQQAINLNESEAFRKRIFNSSRVPIVVMDALTYKYVDCNAAAIEIYHCSSPSEVIGKSPLDFSDPVQYDGTPSPQKALTYIEKTSADGSVVFEWRHKRPNGEQWDGEVHLMSFESADRKFLQFTLQDITERRLAEVALRKSEEKFSKAFRNSPDVIAISNLKNGQVFEVNDSVLKILGFTREETIGKSTIELGIWDDLKLRDEYISRLKRDGNVRDLDVKYRTKSGTIIDTLFSGEIIEIEGEQCILATIRDISERKRAEKATREAQELYENIFRLSPVLIVVTTEKEGRYLAVNDAHERITGYSREEVIGHAVSEFPAWGSSAERQKTIQQLHEVGIVRNIEVEFHRKSGESFTALYSAVLAEIDGKRCVVSMLMDISERKVAEEALQKSEERYRRLLESVTGYVYTVEIRDGKGVGTRHSQGCLAITGYQPEDYIRNQNLWISMIPTDDREKVLDAVEKVLCESAHVSLEHRIIRKDGNIRWLHATLVPHNDQNGSITSYDGLISDITDRKIAEEALQESEDRFRQMAENIEEIFFLYQKDGNKLLYMSPVVSRIFGVDLDMIKADPQMIDRAVHPEDFPQTKFTVHDIFYSTPINEEFRVITPTGAVLWIRLRSFLIHNNEGNVVRVAGLASDITGFKNAQEENLRQQQQLVQADKMASLGLLVSGIAHEINNPNNYISLSTPLLRKAWDSLAPCIESCKDKQAEMTIGSIPLPEFMQNIGKLMDGIEDGSKKIKRIVSDLKNYARQDSLEMRLIDINNVVKSSITILLTLVKKRTKNFSIEYSPSAIFILGNLQRLEQVIINLVQNACDALTDQQQYIKLTCKDRGQKAAIVVTDNGCGIKAEDLNKIVDPFFTTKRETGGTGLGLSVSMGIVKEHHGEMLFDSQPGKGTTVTLLFDRK